MINGLIPGFYLPGGLFREGSKLIIWREVIINNGLKRDFNHFKLTYKTGSKII